MKALQLELHPILHLRARIDREHHRHPGSHRVEQTRLVRTGHPQHPRLRQHQRHRRIQHVAHALAQRLRHAHGDAVLQTLHGELLSAAAIPIDRQYPNHVSPFVVLYESDQGVRFNGRASRI